MQAGDPETLFATDAVTSGDNIFIPREDADNNPALRLGRWTNWAELAVGLRVASYTSDSLNLQQLDPHIDSSGYSRITTAKYQRRAVEEWKYCSLTADEVVSPQAYNLLGGNWDSLVYGEGATERLYFSRLVSMILGLNPTLGSLSWSGNWIRLVNQTFTGIRTNNAMWLDERSGDPTCTIMGTSLSYITDLNMAR